MASQEMMRGAVSLNPSHLAVVRSLHEIPSLHEALSPDYMIEIVVPLARAEVRWKMDHSLRVAVGASEVHGYLGSSRATQLANEKAGIAHDAFQARSSRNEHGWVNAADKIAILNKSGLLTPQEWTIIHDHPTDAGEYLKAHGEEQAADLAVHHHSFQGERSYPYQTRANTMDKNRLRNNVVFAAMDTTDALFTPRPYPKWVEQNGQLLLESGSTKAPWTPEAVREELDNKFGVLVEGHILDLVLKVGHRHAGETMRDFASAT